MDSIMRAGLGNAVIATLLAMVAALLGRGLRRHPAVRHALWLLVLLKLITPPLFVVPITGPQPPAPAMPAAPDETLLVFEGVGEAVPPDAPPLDDVPAFAFEPAARPEAADVPPAGRWEQAWAWWRAAAVPALGGVWLLGSVAACGIALVRIARWRQLLRFAEPAPEEVQERVDELAAAIGLARTPSVWWFAGPVAPMVWAIGCRPRLIVPVKLWDRLDKPQRTTLLLHELAHLQRRDHWVRILELAATALYWWLPVAWIARRQLREAEEQCCDAWVVWTCPDAARTYAEALLDAVDFLSETGRTVPLAASGFGYVHHLKRRVTMIMQGTTPRALSWTGLLAMFGLSTLCLPLSPTWARADDDPERSRERSIVVIQGKGDEGAGERSKSGNLMYVVRRSRDERDDDSDRPNPKEAKRGKHSEERTVDEIVAQILKKIEAERATKGKDHSIDELRSAILDKMEGELKKFAKEAIRNQGDAERARGKLEEALSQMSQDGGMKMILQKKLHDQRIWQDDPMPAERKKEVAEAVARVEKARAQLREAEALLAKLRGAMPFWTARLVPPRPSVPPRPFMTKGGIEFNPVIVGPNPSDRRIDELERKLDKLVDEIKSLRQERERAK